MDERSLIATLIGVDGKLRHTHRWQEDSIVLDFGTLGIRYRRCDCGAKETSDPFSGKWQPA